MTIGLEQSASCDLCAVAELSKWLEPLEKLRFDISSIPTLIEYIKQVGGSRLLVEGTCVRVAMQLQSALS